MGYFFVAIKRQVGPIFVYTYAFGNVFVYTFFSTLCTRFFHFARMLSMKQDKCCMLWSFC